MALGRRDGCGPEGGRAEACECGWSPGEGAAAQRTGAEALTWTGLDPQGCREGGRELLGRSTISRFGEVPEAAAASAAVVAS